MPADPDAMRGADRAPATTDPTARRAASVRELAALAASGATVEALWHDLARRACLDLDGDAAIALASVGPDRMRVADSYCWPTPLDDAVLPVAPDSQAAYVVRTDAAVHSVYNLEDRFVPGRFVTSAGFGSGVSTRIGPSDDVIGLIGVQYRDVVVPDSASIAHLRSLAGVVELAVRYRTLEARARHEIDHDSLTGLVNRQGLFAQLDEAVASGEQGCVLLLDLDGFKAVNDTHGHGVGDEVLRVIAARMRASVRPSDLVARLSGDEFVVLAIGPDRGEATDLAERLVGHIEQSIAIPHGHVMVSAAVGIAMLDGDRETDVAALLSAADRAMYTAKASGRGQVRLAGGAAARRTAPARPEESPIGAAFDLADVERAIEQVRVVFQPIVDVHGHRISGVEALTRGPAGSRIESPIALYRVAETWGRLVELELAAKRAAFATPLPPDWTLFVNIDPTALTAPGFVDSLVRAWETSPNAGRRLVIELTERHLNLSPGRLLRAVRRCRDAGWSVALDDVGARSESLTALPVVRPDVVKLDVSLINTGNRQHVAATTVALAGYCERWPTQIVAEGIETTADAETALALGATHLQGYLFGRPLPIDELLAMPGLASGTDPDAGVRRTAPIVRTATRSQLIAISRHLESLATHSDSIVVTSIQHADHYTPGTRRQYAALARRCGTVAVVGVGLTPGVRAGVHHASLLPDDPLASSWYVLVLQPTGSVGLLASALPQTRYDDGERLFSYRITMNRDTVDDAARHLLDRF